jgi:hypothetical protein
MKTFVLWILTLNAQTGDLIDSRPEGDPLGPDDCVKAMIEKGPQLVKDGKATVYVCYNLAKSTTQVRI